MYFRESTSRAFTLLAKNPPLLGRMLFAKAKAIRPAAGPLIQCRFGDVLFEIDSSLRVKAAAMRSAASSPLVVDAMKRYLYPGGIFIDVGANIGYLAAIGASLVGPRGQIHCFEPVPRYVLSLRRLVELNPRHFIVVSPFAVGAVAGVSKVHVTREPGQNTLVPGYKSGAEVCGSIEVPVVRLDSYIDAHELTHIDLIKIDAEGFELPILEGLTGFFDKGQRPTIICEVAPRAYPLLGREIGELAHLMSRYGYSARDIIDGKTAVHLSDLKHVTDVLFLADN
jgi:FkbM family methyltransferase